MARRRDRGPTAEERRARSEPTPGAALIRLRRRRAPRTDAYICSFPKCGRTWLRHMVACYLSDTQALGVDIDLSTIFRVLPNLEDDPVRGLAAFAYQDHPGVPLVASSHDVYRPEFSDRPVVWVTRDPLDTIVSLYFHHAKQWRTEGSDLETFAATEGPRRLATYVNSWTPHLGDAAHVVTYEHMTEATADALRGVCGFLGLPLVDDAVDRAVASSSFAAMTESEQRTIVAGHDYDPADPDARRVRRGRVHGYEDYLSPDAVARTSDALRDLLSDAARTTLARHPGWRELVED